MSKRSLSVELSLILSLGLIGPGCDTESIQSITPKKTVKQTAKAKTAQPNKGLNTGDKTRTTSITVQVPEKKKDGKKWDVVGGKADVSMCVTVNDAETCFSAGKIAPKIKKPTCKNARSCTFRKVPIAGKTMKFRIVDVDVGKQDLIGEGSCKTTERTCQVGLAKVKILRPLKPGKDAKALGLAKGSKTTKAPPAKPAPPPIPDLAAKKLPKPSKLIGQIASCTVSGKPKLRFAKKTPKALKKDAVSDVYLQVKCGSARKRALQIFVAKAQLATLFETSKNSVIHVKVKKQSKKIVVGLLHKIVGAPKAWWPTLPPSPRLAKGFDKANAAHQKAVQTAQKENTKKVAALAKAQAKALANVPKKHSKERSEMIKRQKSEIADEKKEVNDAIKELNQSIAEQKKECREGDAEDRRDCMNDVKESQAENNETIREKRQELKDKLKELSKEHDQALKDQKSELAEMKSKARQETSLTIHKLQQKMKRKIGKLERKRNAALGKKYANHDKFMALVTELQKARKAPMPDTLQAAMANARGEALKYPAPCKGLDMSRHIEIRNDKGWCIPKFPGYALLAGAKKFAGMGEDYDDDHPFIVMGRPDKRAEETSEISGKERSKRIAQAKKDVYFSLLNNECKAGYDESPKRLNISCNLTGENLYTSNPPKVSKKQECDTTRPAKCVDRCSEDSECRGFTCGCRRSRCHPIFRVCTRCPPETICADPEFSMTETAYSDARKLSGVGTDIAREISMGMGDYRAVMGFKGNSVWRKLDTKRECETDFDGEKECTTTVQHNSGYWLRANPLFLGYVKCRDRFCKEPTIDGVAVRTQNFSVTLTNQGHSARVTCQKTCRAVKSK